MTYRVSAYRETSHMSYLALFKKAEAQLRATQPGDAVDALNAESHPADRHSRVNRGPGPSSTPATPDPADGARALPEPLRDFARFAYMSGWRKGEVRTLTWPDVDRPQGLITLRRAHSKNREPRVLVLVGGLGALIERRWGAREYKGADGHSVLSPYVFHRNGLPVGDCRKAWQSACEAAGAAGTVFHDLRRSAVRNFERAGVSQAVAMKISGHKTASVYRRYRIVDERDIRDALERTEANLRQAPLATVTPLRGAADDRR